ncbi:PREDICTED: DNA repair endonuclease UVH1 [Nicotiana attenuata]|uniref:Dna repair endonuclease uvh1 n=1 Tax=Nicotiana attenuata TaxID=49451 RepID=A0A1J6IX76_NICAT|nr:PREDICTED: DNA repair endonuclease UVH1 [Nicotiana attenuata]OIS99720.1 dna repair endonuclease uvh1 [Nicotiana attenuata]
MVQFQEHIITELLEDTNGGLVVTSSGLGLHKLISSLFLLHHHSQGCLLILSATPSQKASILRNYENVTQSQISDEVQNSPAEITSDLPANQRLSLYSSGGILFITSRILIVDLLTRRLPTTAVAGLIVLNAHLLSDTSTEAFIVRILRSTNRDLYVRAFSDRPHSMVSGFAKAERTLKCLFLRKLHLWPRFQVYVSQDLERNPPEVVDIRVPMSTYMLGIQKAVIEVMDACLKEMRKTNKVDVEDLTVENGLFKSFDEIVRRQLDPIWHTLGKRTKQLVSDLKTLRKLLDYLVRYDAVNYLKFLDSLRASESFRSVWIFAESSYKIFEYAKKRVYHFGRSDSGKLGQIKTASTKKRKLNDNKKDEDQSTNTESRVVLEEVLEEPPKWKVLLDVLVEIQEERDKRALSGEEKDHLDEGDDNGIVLVACKDEHSCMQLEDCITNGPQKVMREEWEKYLLSKVQLQALPKRNAKKAKELKGFGVLDGVVATAGKKAEVSSISKQEHDALLAAASEISKRINKDTNAEAGDQKHVDDGGFGKGKGKGKKKKSSAGEKTNNDVASTDKAMEGGFSDEVFHRKHDQGLDAESSRETKKLPPVVFYALESDQKILDILKPSTIIAYHPDIAFVREVEIYKAENPLRNVKVYFLFYEDSTEVQKFEASVRRENGAFESLIRQKSLMMIPVDQDGRCLGLDSSNEPQSVISQNLITRKAGGRREAEKEIQVIVDMREFMSSLPNVLHQKGMRIIPVTLEVGDYILSPLICVERKSIQDLFGSFASGRLYHQVEMMSRYYRIPVLLIEFSQDKSFSFQSASEIGDDVTPNSIISKLSLLVLHFPRLRIIWSRSLHATAEIFASLKANQDEPDEVKAIRVGVPSEEGVIENDVRAENYNTSAVELLRRLPGVTDSNYRVLMDGCKSLAELAMLPMERLAELMGGQKAAKMLRDFLDAKYPTLL